MSVADAVRTVDEDDGGVEDRGECGEGEEARADEADSVAGWGEVEERGSDGADVDREVQPFLWSKETKS